jgi:aspartyl-tRNA(Asn)/glutamyl-tRNA(Gln) amidotransferase subunit A
MDLHKLTITQAREKLKNKEISAGELAKDCLARIKSLDGQVKAYVTVDDEEVLKQVSALDEGKRDELPLWGIPVAVKDNFLTCGLRTTASSKVLEDFSPVYESTVTQRLRNAGAIILGKTNMDAWAHGSSTETSQFFTTHNPWDLNRLPGGSSGGSGAAVAADMAIGSIGSETAGSVRQPAAWCGVTGLKPTYGVVSRYGVVAMASSTDSPGPMTKDAKDARVIFDIIRGRDPHDATSVDFTPRQIKDLSQTTIGVPKEYFLPEIEEEVKQKVLEAIKIYEGLGLKTVEVSLLDPRISISVYTIVQRSEVSSNLGRYDGIRYGNDRTSFGDEAKRRIMLGTYTLSSGYYDAYYLRAEKVRTLILKDFDRVFKEVDVLMAPTAPSVALPIGATKDASMFGELADILVEASSLAGLPGINLNVGFSKENLPVGMQIIGPKFSEYQLLDLAEKYQEVTNWHKLKPAICNQ